MIYVGIDSGTKGALSVIENDKITSYIIGDDPWALKRALNENGLNRMCAVVYLEETHSIYMASKGTMHTMGRNLGKCEGMLACFFDRVEMVRPKKWQGVVWAAEDVVEGNTKATSLNAVKRLYPQAKLLFGAYEKVTNRRSKPHDGIVDSILIAHYGKIMYNTLNKIGV